MELLALAALVALSATTPQAAWAQRIWGVEVSGGWNIYDLSAVNDSIHSLNQTIGSQLGDIHDGAEYGAALRCWANSRLLMRLIIEMNSVAAKDGSLRYDLGTWNLLIGGTRFFLSERRLRLGAGVAAGIAWLSGGLTGPGFSLAARGSGPDI